MISMQQAKALIPMLKRFLDQCQLNRETTVARVKELPCDGRAVRVALLEGLWWVFCADAAPQIDHSLGAESLFAQAPESERRMARTEIETCVYLVSSRYLLFRLGRSETINHYRFRAWFCAWKTITEATVIRGR
ncbi:MAG: hypothetical protein ACR652_10640 [Methylocystis sp.]|uniref:hypothetical protein n=1 Tax=Methylocystis sp. TaxID=1911079 RepID=UPI003DA4BBFA